MAYCHKLSLNWHNIPPCTFCPLMWHNVPLCTFCFQLWRNVSLPMYILSPARTDWGEPQARVGAAKVTQAVGGVATGGGGRAERVAQEAQRMRGGQEMNPPKIIGGHQIETVQDACLDYNEQIEGLQKKNAKWVIGKGTKWDITVWCISSTWVRVNWFKIHLGHCSPD